jgi:hypothetical protein
MPEAERHTLQLAFQQGEILPAKGETVLQIGGAGTYLVKIHHVGRVILRDDGGVNLVVDATRTLIWPIAEESGVRNG